MKIETTNGSSIRRLWVVQRWNDRGGWFDWSIWTTLAEAENEYVEMLSNDGTDKNTRIVRVERTITKESASANSI